MLKTIVRLAFAAAIIAGTAPAFAQADWPNKPILWIIPFPAGGQADIATRIVAEKMSQSLGQPVVVEAKPGANGTLGTEEVARAAPDGYTWLSTGVPLTTAPAMNPGSLSFDPVKDFEAVIRFANTSFVFVVPPQVPANTLQEFIDYAKEQNGALSYAGSGIGSLVHLGTEMFKLKAGIDMQMIPYTGQPPAIADLLANRVQFMLLGVSLAKPLIESGKLKPLAVVDAERNPVLPDVPTIGEAGFPDLVMGGWAGLQVPAGTPREIVERINAEVTKAVQSPDVAAQLTKAGWTIVPPQSPEEFKAFIEKEIANWQQTVTEAHIEVN
jgi:tripartite-type tricarboxylate transporter receptor subunit TctC